MKKSFFIKGKEGFVLKNSMLGAEFDKYILEHPEFADDIPDNALVVMQIDDDEAFNNWAKDTAKHVCEKGQLVVYVTITDMKPVSSRIEKMKLELVS